MSTAESINRSIGDKLLILGAHYNTHPELPGFVLMFGHGPGLDFRIQPQDAHMLPVWAETLSEITWMAERLRQDEPIWSVTVRGSIATMPVSVSASLPPGFADSADAVIAKLTESTVGVR